MNKAFAALGALSIAVCANVCDAQHCGWWHTPHYGHVYVEECCIPTPACHTECDPCPQPCKIREVEQKSHTEWPTGAGEPVGKYQAFVFDNKVYGMNTTTGKVYYFDEAGKSWKPHTPSME